MDEEEVARFECRDDEGNAYVVVEIQEFARTRMKSGRIRREKASRRLQLVDGSFVNSIDPNTFEIARSGKMIKRLA